jgi:intein/homing endonuclease
MVSYHSISFRTKLPEFLMPLHSKYDDFADHRDKMNEQFRFPYSVVKPFVDIIQNKLNRNNGYVYLEDGTRRRVPLPYSKTWCSSYKSDFVLGYKLKGLQKFFYDLEMIEEVKQLDFILNGYFEQIDRIEHGEYHFYDLEIDDPKHAYWSNGFISHNTLGVAIAELMVMLHDQREVAHVGAILSQAKRCYEYQTKFLLNDRIKPIINSNSSGDPILEKMNMDKSVFNLMDRYGSGKIQATLEVLPCTLKSVNGPHVPLVVVDEIDTVSGEGLKAFKDIAGMLDSKGQREALRVGISTRKSRYGLMNQQIEQAEQAGRTVKRWTALEFSQRCPDDRSGKNKTVAYYNEDDMFVITEDQFKSLSVQKQSEFQKNEFPGEKCLKCPIAAACFVPGTLITMSDGSVKPIEDIEIGDVVITHDGSSHRVYDVMQRDVNEDINVITRYGSNISLSMTGEHPLFTDRGWIEAKDVTSGYLENQNRKNSDYLRLPKVDFLNNDCFDVVEYLREWSFITDYSDMVQLYKKEGNEKPHRSKPGSRIKRKIDLNRSFGYLLGIYAAEGFAKSARVDFSLGQEENFIATLIDMHAKQVLGIGSTKYDIVNHSRFKGIKSYIYSTTAAALFAKICGTGAKNKKLDMSIVAANRSIAEGFVNGFWHGDGDHRKDYDFDRSGELSVATISKQMMFQFYQLCSMLGYHTSIRKNKSRIDRQDSWQVRFVRNKVAKHRYQYVSDYGNHFRVKGNNVAPYKGKVYNFSVETNESYIANGVAVHNCLGDAKNQSSSSHMLKPISDPIKKAMENGPDWTLSQLFNLKPSIEGIVYKEFNEKLHVKKWNEMWTILTGSEYPGECDHDAFVRKCHQMKLSCYAGIDWGWSNPSTFVVFFVDSRENVYVVRTEGQTYTNNPTWVQTIKNKWHHMYRVQLYYPDLANPGDAITMRQEGLPCPTEQKKDTMGGIQIVKKWLRSLASPVPKIYFAEDTCQHIVREFGLYHYKTDAAGQVTDDPASEHDHWLDALRYALYELFGKNRMMMVDDVTVGVGSVTDRMGNFTKMPTPSEFAKSRGIQVQDLDQPIDTSKLGKIGTKSELDDDEEDGSQGGFLWSF